MCYLVERFGFMPNGSRWEYLSRSQPPFLSHMTRDVFAVTGDKEWLAAKYVSLEKEYEFWQTKKMSPTGLNGYINYQVHEPALEGACQYFKKRTGYEPEGKMTRQVQEEVFFATLSVCESGWDCTSRFLEDGHHYDAIDLNALLYGMEENMQYFSYQNLREQEFVHIKEKACCQIRELQDSHIMDYPTSIHPNYLITGLGFAKLSFFS